MPTANSQNVLVRDPPAAERVGDVRHASPLLVVCADEHVVHLAIAIVIAIFQKYFGHPTAREGREGGAGNTTTVNQPEKKTAATTINAGGYCRYSTDGDSDGVNCSATSTAYGTSYHQWCVLVVGVNIHVEMDSGMRWAETIVWCLFREENTGNTRHARTCCWTELKPLASPPPWLLLLLLLSMPFPGLEKPCWLLLPWNPGDPTPCHVIPFPDKTKQDTQEDQTTRHRRGANTQRKHKDMSDTTRHLGTCT